MSEKGAKLTRNGDRSQPHTYLIACPQVMYWDETKVTTSFFFSATQSGYSQNIFTYQSSLWYSSSIYSPHYHFRSLVHLQAYFTISQDLSGLMCLHSQYQGMHITFNFENILESLHTTIAHTFKRTLG